MSVVLNPDYDTEVYDVTDQVGSVAGSDTRAADLARVLYRTVAVPEWFAQGGLSTIKPFMVPADKPRWYLLVYSRVPRPYLAGVLAKLKTTP